MHSFKVNTPNDLNGRQEEREILDEIKIQQCRHYTRTLMLVYSIPVPPNLSVTFSVYVRMGL